MDSAGTTAASEVVSLSEAVVTSAPGEEDEAVPVSFEACTGCRICSRHKHPGKTSTLPPMCAFQVCKPNGAGCRVCVRHRRSYLAENRKLLIGALVHIYGLTVLAKLSNGLERGGANYNTWIYGRIVAVTCEGEFGHGHFQAYLCNGSCIGLSDEGAVEAIIWSFISVDNWDSIVARIPVVLNLPEDFTL